MTEKTGASVDIDGCSKGRGKRSAATAILWQSEIDSPHVGLSLACCSSDVEIISTICSQKNASSSASAIHVLDRQDQFARDEAQEQTTNQAMKDEYSTEDNQDDEMGSAMTEEFNSSVMGVSENGTQRKQEAIPFKDWCSARSMEKKFHVLERMGSGISLLSVSGGESEGFEDLRRYSVSMEQAGKLLSSQYKGVVPQPNGRWGAQIYEKHQRVWLGTFNKEEDAARAYDRAALKCRGQEAMINFSPARVTDLEARFMGEYNKEEIVDMLRKHTFDEEFEYYRKRIMMIAARSVAMNNAEVSGSKCSGQRAHVCQENPSAFDGSENAATSGAAKKGLPREHLFDKAVTPSDVGKLNRIVIPKNHAEKYFPVDVNTSKKGLLLSFEDDTGKVWRFRYSYWNSSQSYVLTKGWSRFVKDKKLEAGDIVSFHGGSAQACKLYISWRLNPLRQLRFGLGPQSHQSKGALIYPGNILSSLNPFDSGAQALGVYNTQWMPPLINRVGHVVAEWSQSPATRLNGTFPFYLSEPPTKQTYGTRFYEINTDVFPTTGFHLNLLHNSLNSGDESTNIESVHPFVNCAQPSMAQELATPGHKAASSLDPATKKGVRIFGVTLTETQKSS